MRWLKGRGQAGTARLAKLGDLLALPGAVYALALPAILLSLVCDPSRPLTEFYGGWPLFIYLWLTLAGFLVASDDRLQASAQQLRWPSLLVALVLVGLVIFLVGLGELPAFGSLRLELALGLRGLSSWCFVVAILGFGRKRLDFSTPFLKYANEAVLPFYILHQTVILSVGYFVVQWAIPDLLKWLIVLPVSFFIIMVLYEFLVRRFNVMRFLFGMKPRPKAPAAAYFMGLFLLISAYFVPGSYDRKGPGRFLKDRLIRLGIPLAVFSWVLHPLFVYGGLVLADGLRTPLWRFFATEYFSKYGQPVLGAGPLWFVETLLIFSLVYVLWRLVFRSRPAPVVAETPFPGNGAIALFALLLGVAGFLVRLVFPMDGYVLKALNLQLGFFAQYIALFIVGLIACG
jgi:hypothetical protein